MHATAITEPTTETIAPIAEAILAVMRDLAEVMMEEILLLQKQKIEDIKLLLVRKHKLLMTYQSNMKVIMAHASLLQRLPGDIRTRLKQMGLKLQEVANKNAEILQSASLATQKLVQHIMNTVREETMPKHGYTDPRSIQKAQGGYSPLCKPVAVNRTA